MFFAGTFYNHPVAQSGHDCGRDLVAPVVLLVALAAVTNLGLGCIFFCQSTIVSLIPAFSTRLDCEVRVLPELVLVLVGDVTALLLLITGSENSNALTTSHLLYNQVNLFSTCPPGSRMLAAPLITLAERGVEMGVEIKSVFAD